jgi:hypothetical protein
MHKAHNKHNRIRRALKKNSVTVAVVHVVVGQFLHQHCAISLGESRSMLLSLLLCLTIYSFARSATTTLYEYDLSDATASTAYPQGDKEYHCFDIDDSGNKFYVRGTYGHFGYFEGAVDASDPQVFYVNWFENAVGTLTPTSGSATLTYTANFDEVNGPYWNTGSSDFQNSFGGWLSINGAVFADDSTIAGQTSMLARCLYPGASQALPREDVAALNGTIAVTGESHQGENTLCYMPAGPVTGSWLGTYMYVYDDDDGGGTEEGNYGTKSFAFWGASGMGYVGTFHASTGRVAGTKGPVIYMIVADFSKTYLVGFFCNVDGDYVRTECFTEYYEVTKVDHNANNCPRFYRLDGTLDPLYEFASTGSSESDAESTQVPTILAILFGCLSGMLILVVGYLAASIAPQQQKVVVAA